MMSTEAVHGGFAGGDGLPTPGAARVLCIFLPLFPLLGCVSKRTEAPPVPGRGMAGPRGAARLGEPPYAAMSVISPSSRSRAVTVVLSLSR